MSEATAKEARTSRKGETRGSRSGEGSRRRRRE
jgi:hypothetical protein